MAAPKSKTSPQDSLLSCPVCMDIYKTPRMLPCQHTLCETCLHSYIVNKSRERVLVSDFPCPVCRTSTPTPRAFTRIDTWASLFPLNHLLVSLLDSSFQELIENRNESEPEQCLEHAGKFIEFFCTEHGVQVCSKCFKNSHRQCDVIDIEDHIEFTSRFGTVKADVENVQIYLNDTVSHLKNNIEQLLSQKSAIITEVKDFRTKVETLLNSFETDIKDQVNVQHDGEVVVLKAQCEKYERIKSDVEVYESSLEELPVSGNIAQSLESISTVENEIKSHVSFLKGCHSNIKLIKLEFAIENQLLSFLNSFNQIGNVYVNHFDANIKKPPELMSRGSTHNESFVPSPREVADEHQSPAKVRHHSPRSLISARPPVVSTSNTRQAKTPPRNTKQPKRPLTVPIESTTPTPVVLRPRAERPDTRTIPHFLPRSFSSPVNETIAAELEGHRKVTNQITQNEQKSDGTNESALAGRLDVKVKTKLANNTVINHDETSSAFLPDTDVETPGTQQSDENGQNRRSWQYVNIRPEISETLMVGNHAEGSDSTEAQRPFRQLLRARSVSTSELVPENATKDATHANRIVRNFHEQSKARTSNPSSPLYENTSSVSGQLGPVPKSDGQLEASGDLGNEKHCMKVMDVCVRIQCDAHECTITGSAELSDKRMVLIDCNNCRVKLLGKDLVYQAHIDMSKEPWNVTATGSNEVAVTVPLEKAIHIIRVLDKSMETIRCITTRRECWGICFADNKFIVSTKDDGNIVLFLDITGRELQIVNFASRENPSILRPVSVSAALSDNVLYVSCEGQSGTRGAVVRMSQRGDVLYVFTNKEIDRPYSITVDRASNVFITAIRSANVAMLSEGGAKVMTMLSRDNGLCRPQHIQVLSREMNTSFLLSERRVDNLSVYELK